MNRRSVIKSAVSVAAGLGASSAGSAAAKVPKSASIVTADGVRLFHREWGAGKPLVFLAPWGLHSDWWEGQMAYFAGRGLRTIACDRRGHGRSDEPVSGYDFDTLAGDLNATLEGLDLRDVTLVGHSMGSGEVVRYLSRHGSRRIARIALIAPITPFLLKTADNPEGMDSSFLDRVRQALSADRPNVIASAAPSFFGAPQNAVSAEMMQWWTNMLLGCPLKVLIELHHAFTETDFRSELSKIVLPTLIVHGDNDTSAPIDLTGRKTAKLIPGSKLVVYAGAAHGLTITHRDRLNADLLAFITG
jgi:non-heme chloroperoxidase